MCNDGKVWPDISAAIFDAVALGAADRLMKEQSTSPLHIAVAARKMGFVHARALGIKREIFEWIRVRYIDHRFLIAAGCAEHLAGFVESAEQRCRNGLCFKGFRQH